MSTIQEHVKDIFQIHDMVDNRLWAYTFFWTRNKVKIAIRWPRDIQIIRSIDRFDFNIFILIQLGQKSSLTRDSIVLLLLFFHSNSIIIPVSINHFIEHCWDKSFRAIQYLQDEHNRSKKRHFSPNFRKSSRINGRRFITRYNGIDKRLLFIVPPIKLCVVRDAIEARARYLRALLVMGREYFSVKKLSAPLAGPRVFFDVSS